ncbi:MAG: hypothetical protein JNK29_10410 [Anaerolineales bacterium]|nr:hypothetical protein [Anaerolineales bacterium]
MPTTLTIRDESTATLGRPDLVWTLACPLEHLTARELIQLRIQHEVEAYNHRQPEVFQGLVQPSDAERALNGFRLRERRRLDWRRQAERALAAFESNGFILLVDDRQVDSLDQVLAVGPQTTITFLKLVPLVGG